MRNEKSNGSRRGVLSPLLLLLLSGSLSLAIVDKENRPVYFQIVNLVAIYSFDSIQQKEVIEELDSKDDSEDSDS
ncbi:MAG: hypothetical protein KME60_16235 [Cyanomargarita calcarea GSE-NOS-MK-12-04C]|jgi:hypothetical protein|uniref:Uncharacterized protein n=1 Tax=Cyanomargarita calcarea GSE-NOS-MK-12-04C TaxID=2839659 RepID=A0A951UTV5_9CYAN|nr:hypothetical protein [Cyanomargarita calcarea GSE-NOS-MK-12-04C]